MFVLNEVSQMRWCRHADVDGACQVFMRRVEPAPVALWETFIADVGFEAAPGVPQDVKRARELWRDYAAAFADDRSKELYSNVIVFDAARKDPEEDDSPCPKRPRVDGRRRNDERVGSGTADAASQQLPVDAVPPASNAPPPFFKVIQKFLEDMFPGGYPDTGLLSADNWVGIGHLRPDVAPPGTEVSTLETHRRVLALERAGAGLLQLLLNVFIGRQARRYLSPDDALDAEIAFEFQGGVAGEGAQYWIGGVAPPLCAFADRVDTHGRGDFYRMLCYLRANRAAAFRRRYVVADDAAWGMPIIASLHALRAATPNPTPADAAAAIAQLVCARRCAALADTVRLVRYGSCMSHYCMRLQLILRQLMVGVSPTLAVARFPGDPEGHVLPVDVQQTVALHEFSDETADLIVQLRMDIERKEVNESLQGMQLRYCDALVYVHAISLGIRIAMERDGHLRNHTCFLHGSPSLPAARYAAYMYATAMSVE